VYIPAAASVLPPANPSNPSSPSSQLNASSIRLININGTLYVVSNGQRRGITNPGMLYTYGLSFKDAAVATAADQTLPEGGLVLPANGALVKSKEDPTVYLISNGQRYGFVSAKVFATLGFKFSSLLVVTNPELQALPKSSNLDNPAAAHLSGLDINKNGTVYWLGSDRQLHGYPSLAVYNSWRIPGDFSRVVPANDADMALPMGNMVEPRALN
jgi:hypothetical protein